MRFPPVVFNFGYASMLKLAKFNVLHYFFGLEITEQLGNNAEQWFRMKKNDDRVILPIILLMLGMKQHSQTYFRALGT